MSESKRWVLFSSACKHYATAFRQAWRQRRELDAPWRLPHETQFLPATLALQETPLSPAPRVAMWALMTFAFLTLIWSIFGQIDLVASAAGRIVPNGRTKTIQPFETSTVKAIHVTDGQRVGAGALLIELDATVTAADKQRLAGELEAKQLQVARAQAMLAGLQRDGAPPLPLLSGVSEERWQQAQQLLLGHFAAYRAGLQRLEADIARAEAEQRSVHAQVSKLVLTLPWIRQREADFKRLARGSSSAVSEYEYQKQKQSLIEHEADLQVLKGRQKEIAASVRKAHEERQEHIANARRQNLDSLTEARQHIAALEQESLKAGARDRLMRLVSPIDGMVQQLTVHTVGGVVTPAQPLMMIVPLDNSLEIEAMVENKDIGFVRVAQAAEVKIETFPYTKYGTIPATVASVSHDAIENERRGLMYSTRVRLARSTIEVDGARVNLTPGMAVTVEIKTGKRRVIEFFLSPLRAYAQESLRER